MAASEDLTLPAEEDILRSGEAGGRVIRGSAWRAIAGVAGSIAGVGTAALLLRHLGVAESGRYVTVISLLSIPVMVGDLGLNVSASRWLALRAAGERRALVANVLAQRLLIMPLAIVVMLIFAVVVGYPQRMILGVVLAGAGFFLAAVANALLLPLSVQLRNVGLAVVDFMRQGVTLVGVALLVALGASLTPFFAVQIASGLSILAITPLLAGRRALMRPRFERSEQRLLARSALPLAAALTLGQLYFRLVIVLMSLISPARQTGYFGASLRAIEAPVSISILIAGVALPLLAAAAHEDRARLRYAVEGLGKGAVIVGTAVVIVALRGAEPVMAIIGGGAFRPAGAVLRIQVGILPFNALYQIWTAALLALGRQRELILTNLLALAGVALAAALLVPAFGAQGGAAASVIGDALLAALIYWRVRLAAGPMMVPGSFLLRVGAAAAPALAFLILLPGIPALAAALAAGAIFLVAGQLIGMIPPEVHAAFRGRRRGAGA